jgi:uncharacterized protein YceK
MKFFALPRLFAASALSVSVLCTALLPGCASVAPSTADEPSHGATANAQTFTWHDDKSWQTFTLPSKKTTRFSKVAVDGRDAVMASADGSASMLRQQMRVPADQLQKVRFSWKVPQLIVNSDLALREGDDSPVRVVLAFEGDRSKWSSKNAMLSELTRVLTGEEMPYATLMYVWSNQHVPESIVLNPRTDRIRKLVVESGPQKLKQWLDYERNIKADFERAFGEAPGALVGIALMTDTDNTRSSATAYYGPVSLHTPAQPTVPATIPAADSATATP